MKPKWPGIILGGDDNEYTIELFHPPVKTLTKGEKKRLKELEER